MAEETILNLMINHHALLEVLFVSFKDEVKDKTKIAESTLSELTWEMKKHFFAEEAAIFDFPPLKIIGVWTIVEQLKKEHVLMLEDLKYFSDNLSDLSESKVDDFYSLLENHRKIEEINLYPRLDSGLQPLQRQQIIGRISEIPINK